MRSLFDKIIVRRETNSYKWDSAICEDVLPMWVADMDFRTAPKIIEALRRRVEHGIFGYTKVPDHYYDSIVRWLVERHRWQIKRGWITYTTGVVPALSAVIKAITLPMDKVIVQTPVYNCFFSSIRNNGCEVVTSPLIYSEGAYTIDFDDLEVKTSDTKTKILLLCNPHNPVGRVFTREELIRLGEICVKNGVLVVSDEIHCDLVYEPYVHTPFASLSEMFLMNSVTCISPSKAFNIAGLQIANIVCADPELRSKIEKAININEVCDVNPFGVDALIAAYNHGEQWLDELKQYLYENYNYLKNFFLENMPEFIVTELEGSYLVWIDCRALNLSSKMITDAMLEDEHIMVSSGSIYGDEGEGFIRINIATPRELLCVGLERLMVSLKRWL